MREDDSTVRWWEERELERGIKRIEKKTIRRLKRVKESFLFIGRERRERERERETERQRESKNNVEIELPN